MVGLWWDLGVICDSFAIRVVVFNVDWYKAWDELGIRLAVS